jgi:DNA processing protein
MSGALVATARPIAADGTDADVLAALVGWACAPRRDLDGLRRRLRDAGERDGSDGSEGRAPAAGQRLARLAGPTPGWLEDAARQVLATWGRLGVRVAVVGDAAYPVRLAEGWPVTDAPTLIAWRGAPPADAGPGVAIVGSRRASSYGIEVATWLAHDVARAGGRVVSGGAVGIDAAAHRAAIGLPGGTTVVLGCGHDVPYPAAHARRGGLFDRILEDGGTLVSELLPQVRPHPGVIRARNRVLAALAEVTVVVEGGSRSGALLTAGAAAERGRAVLAVPGDVRAAGSVAPLRLLAEGAEPCASPADVLAHLPPGSVSRVGAVGAGETDASPTSGAIPVNGARAVRSPSPRPPGGVLDVRVAALLTSAWPRPLDVDELAMATGVSAAALLTMLTRARIAGEVVDVDGGVRLRTAQGR